MTWDKLGDLLDKKREGRKTSTISPSQWRKTLPQLAILDVDDHAIQQAEPILLDQLAQERICTNCSGYKACGKLGDAKGMYDYLSEYHGNIIVKTSHCKPYLDYLAVKKAARFQAYTQRSPYDKQMTFVTFPDVQKHKKPQMYQAAESLANTYQAGHAHKGLYIFGQAGVGKTHLLHAMINRLEERAVPCIFVQAEALFDRLRSMIGDSQDIEPMLDAFSTVPVLAIDEIGQERANAFTLEKMFRIINHRFSAKLPTLFASNFAPPDLYKSVSQDLLGVTDPLKSRIIGMSQVAYLEGDDYRIATMEFLDA